MEVESDGLFFFSLVDVLSACGSSMSRSRLWSMSLSSLKEVSAERTALSILTGLAVPVDADRVIIDAAHAYPLVTGLDASDGNGRPGCWYGWSSEQLCLMGAIALNQYILYILYIYLFYFSTRLSMDARCEKRDRLATFLLITLNRILITGFMLYVRLRPTHLLYISFC